VIAFAIGGFAVAEVADHLVGAVPPWDVVVAILVTALGGFAGWLMGSSSEPCQDKPPPSSKGRAVRLVVYVAVFLGAASARFAGSPEVQRGGLWIWLFGNALAIAVSIGRNIQGEAESPGEEMIRVSR
jgi:hypothetical protein